MVNQEFKNHVNKCKKVIEKFGITTKFECTNYIMPDGRQINGCKKNRRKYKHLDIGIVYGQQKDFPLQLSYMEHFMKHCNAIRFRKTIADEKKIRVHAIHKPTEKQAQKIIKAVIEGADSFYGYKETDTIHQACESTIDNPTGLDVRRWISKCWR